MTLEHFIVTVILDNIFPFNTIFTFGTPFEIETYKIHSSFKPWLLKKQRAVITGMWN
jgi:hypothetical protein